MAVTAGVSMALLSISSAAGEAESIKNEANFEAKQKEFNSRIAEMQAENAKRRGQRAATKVRKKGKQVIGAQRAALAAQGIQLDDGSALAVQEETAAEAEIDAITVEHNAFREAWGHSVDASNSQLDAQFNRISGESRARRTLITGGIQGIKSGIAIAS